MQYDVIEDAYQTEPDDPSVVLTFMVHLCTCADTSDHPPRVHSNELLRAGGAIRASRLRMMRDIDGVATVIFDRDAYRIVVDASNYTWGDVREAVMAAATHSFLDAQRSARRKPLTEPEVVDLSAGARRAQIQ